MDFIYGTLTYKCSIPSNPNLIDCKIEEMGRGDFRVEVGKRFCKMSQHGILEGLKSELVKMFWSDDYRLPKDTREVLNELGATSEQKAKVANEFEMVLKTSPFCQGVVNKVADEIRELNDCSVTSEDSDDDDFDDLPNYSCDSGPGGYSPYD